MFPEIKERLRLPQCWRKKGGNWQVIKAGYVDKAGNYIDIMEPHGRGKKQNDRIKRPAILKISI